MDSKALMNRRTAIGAGGAALAGLLLPGRAQGGATPSDPFVILLKGLYQPVVHGPNLGLSAVDLGDGSYSTTKIYPVSGTPGNTDPNKAIGDFYAQFTGDLCAYHIPGGSLAMQFTFVDDKIEDPPPSDGQGGTFFRGTLELNSSRPPAFIGRLLVVTTTWWTTCISSQMGMPSSSATATSAARRTTV